MTLQTFRDLLGARPFQPFRVVMSSGDKYEIRHPEMAFLTKNSLYVGVNIEEGIPADSRICSLLHIATIEPIEGKAA